MAGWQRCDSCRKVLQAQEFDGDGGACKSCRTAPARKPRAVRSTAVTQIRRPETTTAPQAPRLGVAGSGDLEVRERRARRAAHQSLAEQHADEFELLLAAARAGEGLRG